MLFNPITIIKNLGLISRNNCLVKVNPNINPFVRGIRYSLKILVIRDFLHSNGPLIRLHSNLYLFFFQSKVEYLYLWWFVYREALFEKVFPTIKAITVHVPRANLSHWTRKITRNLRNYPDFSGLLVPALIVERKYYLLEGMMELLCEWMSGTRAYRPLRSLDGQQER